MYASTTAYNRASASTRHDNPDDKIKLAGFEVKWLSWLKLLLKLVLDGKDDCGAERTCEQGLDRHMSIQVVIVRSVH